MITEKSPSPTTEPKLKISSVTELLDHLKASDGFELTAPVDVDRIASLLGIRVRETLETDHMDAIGKIFAENDGTVTIWVNPFENSYAPRRRFTIAHEIGHFCLHLSETKTGFIDTKMTMSRSESYWDVYESQANSFAAELLMPEQLVKSEGSKIVGAYLKREQKEKMPIPPFIDALARVLNVSNVAMEYRLRNMSIIK